MFMWAQPLIFRRFRIASFEDVTSQNGVLGQHLKELRYYFCSLSYPQRLRRRFMYLRWMDAFECQDVMHPTGGLELLQLYWRICFSRDLFQSYSGVKCSSRKPKYFVQYHLCVCVLLFRDGKDGAIARLLGSVKISKCVIPENAVLKRAYFSESSLQVSVACVKGENWLIPLVLRFPRFAPNYSLSSSVWD